MNYMKNRVLFCSWLPYTPSVWHKAQVLLRILIQSYLCEKRKVRTASSRLVIRVDNQLVLGVCHRHGQEGFDARLLVALVCVHDRFDDFILEMRKHLLHVGQVGLGEQVQGRPRWEARLSVCSSYFTAVVLSFWNQKRALKKGSIQRLDSTGQLKLTWRQLHLSGLVESHVLRAGRREGRGLGLGARRARWRFIWHDSGHMCRYSSAGLERMAQVLCRLNTHTHTGKELTTCGETLFNAENLTVNRNWMLM